MGEVAEEPREYGLRMGAAQKDLAPDPNLLCGAEGTE